MIPQPINIPKWIEQNKDKLQPPINNFCIFRSSSGVPQSDTENDPAGFIVMVVGGPNQRTDYHINPTEEWFYQYKGSMSLNIVDKDQNGKNIFREIIINEGDTLLLPANVPHNPVRHENTVGIVIERHRPVGQLDRMRWYCDDCHEIKYEEAFQCIDLGSQLKPVVEKYYAHKELQVCKYCKENKK